MARRSFAEAAWPSLCLLCLLVCVYYIHATNGVTAQSKILDEIISTKNYVIIMEDEQNSVDNYIPELQDIITPFGSQLKGIYKRSFAYKTIHERLVQILSRVIESLGKEEPGIVQKYGKSSAAELSQVIANINKLKNEISTNAPIVPLVPNHNGSNAKRIKVWNDYLVERTNLDGNVPRWYNTAWIYCECYMYQRLTEAFAHSKTLQSYDPFANQKIQAFEGSIASIAAVANHTLKHINRGQEISLANLKKEFSVFVRLGLWGNRCDLSLSAGVANGQVGNPVNLLQSLESDILVDNTDFIWNCMSKARPTNGSKTIDIVLDNAGYELFTDLCLATFLVGNNVAQKIRFYVKQVPWYISDVTTPDFHWMVTRMRESSDLKLTELGELINGYLTAGVWTIEEEQFWTDPFVYSQMAEKNPVLYAKLSEASFILFKGDLNYRKLVGDINWEYSTTFLQAIQGFVPANLASLRTVKSDVCVGLKPQQGESIRNKDANWMETGQYGLIQATIDTCPCE